MRKILGIVFIVLLVIIAGIAAAVFLVPADVYKEEISKQATALTGREVAINGPVSLAFFPSISAKAKDVTIANPKGFTDEHFASMDEMRASVRLWPLFSKRVEITEFVLVKPVISLEKRKNNAVNWALGSGTNAKSRASANKGFARKPGALPLDASLGDVRIIDGSAIYRDRVKGETTKVEQISLTLSLPDLDKAMRLNGKMHINERALEIAIGIGSLRGFLEGQAVPASVTLKSPLFTAKFDGEFTESKNMDARGTLDLQIPSVRKMAAANGTPFAPGNQTFGKFSAYGKVDASQNVIRFKDARIGLDDISATGSFSARFSDSKPKLSGNLNIERLDINPYIPPPPPPGTAIAPWDTKPFALDGLQAANVNFKIKADSMLVRGIEFGPTATTIALLNGRLQADLDNMTLYGGTGDGRVVLNSRGATPSFSLKANIRDVQAYGLFEAAANFKRLEGIGDVRLDLLGSGSSVDALMRSLSGTSNLYLRDGAIRGVNLASVLRSAQNMLLNGALPTSFSTTETTDFTDLKGSFSIAGGVASNSDMLMSGPLLRVTGKGIVDLGMQAVDYGLLPKAVVSLEGQGGKTDLKGFSAPFRISGHWNSIKAGIDSKALQQMAAKKLEDRAKKEARKLIEENVGGEVGDILQGFLGSKSDSDSDPADTGNENQPREKSDEEKALDVLGGFLGLGGSSENEEDGTND